MLSSVRKVSASARPERSDDYSVHEPGSPLGRLAVRVAARQRSRLFHLFMRTGETSPVDEILDVGVTSDERFETNNYLENWYPHKERITAAGLAPECYLPARFPGLKYRRIEAGARLPFPDQSFDLVHASAVIEHVGNHEQQTAFLREVWRVCRRTLFITTPNRWFPVEVHTSLPFVHWLPARAFRSVLKVLKLTAWADEAQLNLLSRRDLRAAAIEAGLENVNIQGVRLAGLTSNLALIASRSRRA